MGKIMMNGIQYGVGGITDADDIKYTDSQTVKDALDEVKNGLATRAYVGPSKSFNITVSETATYNDPNYVIAGKTYIGTLIYSFAGASVSITAGYAGLSIGVRFVVHNFTSSAQTIDIVYRHIYI